MANGRPWALSERALAGVAACLFLSPGAITVGLDMHLFRKGTRNWSQSFLFMSFLSSQIASVQGGCMHGRVKGSTLPRRQAEPTGHGGDGLRREMERSSIVGRGLFFQRLSAKCNGQPGALTEKPSFWDPAGCATTSCVPWPWLGAPKAPARLASVEGGVNHVWGFPVVGAVVSTLDVAVARFATEKDHLRAKLRSRVDRSSP